MNLLIDASKKEFIKFVLFDKNKHSAQKYAGVKHDYLIYIDKFLKKYNLKPKKLTGVAVVVGAGGFTSTRLACVIANMFAYTLDIPVLAIQANQPFDPADLSDKLKKRRKSVFVSASYSGPASIGIKKSITF
ncbi:MAG: hypothetical protein COU31_03330 [Candidatus Magasanikbacteria bacterium CG10_big_fil_rev_8_21_14_0_10_40_10]|uniref:Gcp-like domain-containing protein n=1 Tax=Candidatus Magasanikbacteria bacterium CG10_big_fil_rev_8_21_14_0_10_40_10 TaxID=1974648 RepID=A0A2M6W3I3_9BACT|nr:MAG: hypothetical protein COU31_03330 [Candidatus Magasanikbacteria bacterium CG10_big_fil_rev_8_21_14_0_10_40_10]